MSAELASTLRIAAALAGWVSLFAAAPAQEAAPGLPVLLETPTGERTDLLVAWHADGPELAEAGRIDAWLSLTPLGADPVAVRPAGWELELMDGAWLPGEPGPGSGDLGLWRLPDGIDLAVDTLWIVSLGHGGLPGAAPGENDVLRLRLPGLADDLRQGWFLSWDDEGLGFEDVGGERSWPWERVEGLQLLVEEPAPAADPGSVWVVLTQGGHLRLRPIEWTAAGGLRGQLPWGGKVELADGSYAALYPAAAPFVDLGAARPIRSEGPVSEVLDWSPKVGRSVEGRVLRVSGREYASGYGVRVPAELAFPVPEAGRFHAWVGIDDEVASYREPQAVRFRILLDDVELATGVVPPVGLAPRLLRVEVPGPGTLRLLAEPAARLPFGGHVDWLQPTFLPASARLRDSG